MNKTIDIPILDACCGGKMFYFDKNDPRVLFQDIREVETTLCDGRKFEVKPDVLADFTSMPYPDNHFKMVVFDLPHLLRNVGKSKMVDMYGSLNEKAQPTGYRCIVFRLARYVKKRICRMFPCPYARRFPNLQMERNRHQDLGNPEAYPGNSHIRAYLRQACQHPLDLFHQIRPRSW